MTSHLLFCIFYLELTPKQIDDILHEIDALDEEQLKEMHEEFIELW